MRWLRFPALLVLLFALLPATAVAGCDRNDVGWLWNYNGTIGDGIRVRMTLMLGGEQVNGVYFYASQLRDIAIKGRIANGTDIVLDELDDKGHVAARFEGRFSGSDPKGRFQGDKLECEIILGTWQKLDSASRLPVYLALESGTAGTLTNRYSVSGADNDELIHRNALRFWNAVKRGDKQAVAALVSYPVRVQLPGGRKLLRSAAELVANYDAVFTPRYRDAILQALPRNMFVRDQGIMLGNGEVWFGADGKVVALNN